MTVAHTPERASTRLREDVLEHLWQRYPQHCVILTDPGTRRAIEAGVECAARHGFVETRQVRAYIRLMVFLGSHFDEDPQLSWAGEHLQRTENSDGAEAMSGLLAEVTQRMEPIVGGKGEYYRRSLAWVEARSFEQLVTTYDDSDDGLRTLMQRLHGRKYEAIGEEAIVQLIARARISAAEHGLTTRAGVVVLLALMFLLGSGIDRDPFHPWAGATLAIAVERHPDELASALHAKSIEVLRRYTSLRGLMHPDEERI
jgi:hypothetical protein